MTAFYHAEQHTLEMRVTELKCTIASEKELSNTSHLIMFRSPTAPYIFSLLWFRFGTKIP